MVVGIDLYNQTTTGEVSKTLNSIRSDSDHVPCVLVLNDQGGSVMNISYDVTSTLRAETKHHEPIVLCVENHPADSRVKISQDDVCQSLTERMGTGGGNVPLVLVKYE